MRVGAITSLGQISGPGRDAADSARAAALSTIARRGHARDLACPVSPVNGGFDGLVAASVMVVHIGSARTKPLIDGPGAARCSPVASPRRRLIASISAAIDGMRTDGDFSRQRATKRSITGGIVRLNIDGLGGCSVRCAASSSPVER